MAINQRWNNHPKLSNVLNKNASKTFYSEGEVNSGLCSILRSMIVTQGVQSPSVIITYFFSLILMTLYMKLLIILSSLFVYFAFAFLLTVPRVILRPSGQILQFRQVSHWGPTGRQVCWPNPTNSTLISSHSSLLKQIETQNTVTPMANSLPFHLIKIICNKETIKWTNIYKQRKGD